MASTAWRTALTPSSALREIRSKIEEALQTVPDPEPRFTYHISWSQDYDALFLNKFRNVTPLGDLYERAKHSGRVILCARGGGAKTVILQRVAKLALASGDLPFILDLKQWDEPTYGKWRELREDSLDRAAFLLAELCIPKIELRELDALPVDVSRVVLVDGLNEVRLSTGNSILDTLDTLVRRSVNTCTIVADRLVRREPPNFERWQLASIRPFTDQEIRNYVRSRFHSTEPFDTADAQTRALLATPYFLDLLLREGQIASSSAQAFRHYFLEHVSLTEHELGMAGLAAFRAYTEDQSRVFDVAAFANDAGEPVWQKLRHAGAVTEINGKAFFSHHLKHDFLAANYVASSPERWNRVAFGVISLGASSFDSIALALEQLLTPQEADLFVRRVYDWNPYAAAYATAEGLERLSVRVSENMQVFMLTMLGERRFDLIEASAQRATDALSVFPREYARRILEAPSLDAIFQCLNEIEGEQSFETWRNLFTRPFGAAATNDDIQSLFEVDSIIGWTAANVLKRLSMSEQQLESLRVALGNADPTTRWRIVHVLGAFPNLQNAESLLSAADQDADEWVRYGATRSLVELAAVAPSAELRQTVFTRIADSIGALVADRRRLEEFERAIFIRRTRAPIDWVSAVGAVIEALYDTTADVEQRNHWRRVAHSLELRYSAGAL
jgi:hypothetical protein